MGWIPTSDGNQQQHDGREGSERPEAQPEPAKPVERKAQPRPIARYRAAPPAPRAFVAPPPTSPVSWPRSATKMAVIEEVREVEKPGQASGVGAVGGGVVGGVLGPRSAAAHGKDLATILGRARRALAGNQVEKTVKKEKESRSSCATTTATRSVHPGHAAELAKGRQGEGHQRNDSGERLNRGAIPKAGFGPLFFFPLARS